MPTVMNDAVKAAILAARIEQDTAMGLRMDGLVDRFEAKLELYEKKIDTKLEALSNQVTGIGTQVDMAIEKVLEYQREQDVKYEARVVVDDLYRNTTTEWQHAQEPIIAGLKISVEEATKDIQHIRNRMKLLGWLLIASRGVAAVVQGVVTTAETGKRVSLAIAAISSSIMLVWTFFYRMLPLIRLHMHH